MSTPPPISPQDIVAAQARIAPRLSALRHHMHAACVAAGRDPASVRLVAVSKRMPAADIAAAHGLGVEIFGENYAQELRDKDHTLASHGLSFSGATRPQWHMIGPLQRNKVHLVVGRAHLLHSVDDPALVAALAAQVDKHRLRTQDPQFVQRCLVQVNLGNEVQKAGCSVDDLPALLSAISQCQGRVQCHGLMCIPPVVDPAQAPAATRKHFATLAALPKQLPVVPHVTLHELSMGMSQDFAEAIAEGATLIRVGTALFGERTY